MKHANLSEIGSVRQNNEDVAWSGKNNFNNLAGIVCDGLGGYKGGSAASDITVEVFKEKFLNTDLNFFTSDQISKWVDNIVLTARKKISDYIKTHDHVPNMATTLVCSLIINNKAYIYNIGDSRAWLISKNSESHQITVDQNVETYLRRIKAPKELFDYHKDNLYAITQFVGALNSKNVVPEIFEQELFEGDFIVLTSDGCHNFVDLKDVINAILFDDNELDVACTTIFSKAMINKSNDNLSIVILGV